MVASLADETTPAPMLDVEAVFVGQNGQTHSDCPYGSFLFRQSGFGLPGCSDQPGEWEVKAHGHPQQQLHESWSAKFRGRQSVLPRLLFFAGW